MNDYWKWHENSWNFWSKSTGMYRKMQDHRDLMNDLDCASKTTQRACKTLRAWTKNQKNFEKFQENFEIFWSKSLWKIDFFSQFCTKYFLDFRIRSESIDIWKRTPDSITIFPISGEGNVPAFPPPDATVICTSLFSILFPSHATRAVLWRLGEN